MYRKSGTHVGILLELLRKAKTLECCAIFLTQLTFIAFTYCPLEVCSSSVTRVDVPGHVQLLASSAYLNSSSHTTCSANLTCSLFSGLKICTYCGTLGAKSFTAHDRRIVCSSCRHHAKIHMNYIPSLKLS